MRKITLPILTYCLLLFSPTIRAQDSTGLANSRDTGQIVGPLVWTLQNCLDYARKNNIQLNTLRLTQESNEQDVLQARAQKLPNLSGSASESYTHSKNANPVVGGFQTQSSFASNYSLNSGVTIYNADYLNNNIKQRQLVLQSAGLSIQQAENDMTLQITQAYLSILVAKESIVYQQDLVNTSTAQVEQAQKRYNAGSIARGDLVQLQAQQANDRYLLVTAQSAYRQNIVNLKQLLQLQVDSFSVVSPDTLIATALVTPLKNAQDIALQSRPEIKNGQLGIAISQLDVEKARAGFFPVLSASGSLSTGYSNNQSFTYLSQLDNNFFQGVGITLSIPIFSNRLNRTNLEKSKIEVLQSTLTLQSTKTALMQTIELAYINVVNAQSQYGAAVEQLNAAQESYRIATEQLKVGVVNIVSLLQQKNLYVQALQAYVQAKYSAVMSVKIYDFYTGVPIKL